MNQNIWGIVLNSVNGTIFISGHTAGADGEISSFNVPGGIIISFTAQAVKFPDGGQIQRIGLVPDFMVEPTIKGVRQGHDEVPEKAIQYPKRIQS